MNFLEKYFLSDESKRLILELKQPDNWDVFTYNMNHKHLPYLRLWIINGWQFLDVIRPNSTAECMNLIPFIDRWFVWKYAKPIIRTHQKKELDKIFTQEKS